MILWIILLVLVVAAFGGGVGYPDGRSVLWIIALILLVVLLFGTLR